METMMAMTIAMILLVMMEKIFLTQQQYLQRYLAVMTIQNKFYFVREIFNKLVRQAGFIGCRRLTQSFSESHPILITKDNLIELETQKDFLVTRSFKPVNQILDDNRVYMIADCQHAELIVPHQTLKYQYQSNAQFYVYEENHFYLKRNSIYLQDHSGKSDEVITGVDAIQVFLDHNVLTIDMIINNEKNINAQPQTIKINKQAYYFTDGKLHRPFKMMIALREKDV